MEFKDKAIDDKYSDLRAREQELEDELDEIRAQITEIIENNEQE